MEYYNTVRARLHERINGFDKIFDYLKKIDRPLIVETGCARIENNFEGDGQSSLMFDAYIAEYGGEFYTVDISRESVDFCRSKIKSSFSHIIQDDSILFLKILNSKLMKEGRKIDFLYLDSFDAPKDNPNILMQSALHHLYEFATIMPSLNKGALVGVDDCWMEAGDVSGKCRFVNDYMKKIGNPPIHAEYQFLWIFDR